ncbi:MAG TPA: hypothetical protein VM537_32300 [Anaerolineae bacterium]|nr:hypothetical protein [Anaerolineae bacterium]
MSLPQEVIFGSVKRAKTEDLKVYNAQVFNVSLKDDLENYLRVMRVYGPMGTESTIKPPETFFSSKDSALFIWVEWMGTKTFREEFLDEPSPVERDLARFGAQSGEGSPALPWSEENVISLADRLASLIDTPDTPDQDTPDGSTDEQP